TRHGDLGEAHDRRPATVEQLALHLGLLPAVFRPRAYSLVLQAHGPRAVEDLIGGKENDVAAAVAKLLGQFQGPFDVDATRSNRIALAPIDGRDSGTEVADRDALGKFPPLRRPDQIEAQEAGRIAPRRSDGGLALFGKASQESLAD